MKSDEWWILKIGYGYSLIMVGKKQVGLFSFKFDAEVFSEKFRIPIVDKNPFEGGGE